jgi:hypothetical protein
LNFIRLSGELEAFDSGQDRRLTGLFRTRDGDGIVIIGQERRAIAAATIQHPPAIGRGHDGTTAKALTMSGEDGDAAAGTDGIN